MAGTPFYLSPELKQQFVKKNSGRIGFKYNAFKSDCYSLGITLLEMARLDVQNAYKSFLIDPE